jgi:hypothetical protein
MLAFDRVHRVPAKIADALSADFLRRRRSRSPSRTRRQPLTFQVARPVLLVAPIDETEQAWTLPRSFSNRTLAIDLEPIGAQRPEASIWPEFEALRPALVTALAETVATALSRIRDIDLALTSGDFPMARPGPRLPLPRLV